jgi:hypothetical protein
MASGKRFTVPVTVEINGEEYDCSLGYGMLMKPTRLSIGITPRDGRKKSEPPFPIEITFNDNADALDFMGRVVSWIGQMG